MLSGIHSNAPDIVNDTWGCCVILFGSSWGRIRWGRLWGLSSVHCYVTAIMTDNCGCVFLYIGSCVKGRGRLDMLGLLSIGHSYVTDIVTDNCSCVILYRGSWVRGSWECLGISSYCLCHFVGTVMHLLLYGHWTVTQLPSRDACLRHSGNSLPQLSIICTHLVSCPVNVLCDVKAHCLSLCHDVMLDAEPGEWACYLLCDYIFSNGSISYTLWTRKEKTLQGCANRVVLCGITHRAHHDVNLI